MRVTMPELAGAIRSHRRILQREILERIQAIADPGRPATPEYAEGTRVVVLAALDYAVAILEGEERQPPPIPEAVLGHARLAARSGVELATVLRRYIAGFSLLNETVLRQVEVDVADRDRLLPALSMHLDFLLARISEDYGLEQEDCRRTSRTRRAEEIALLLAGMPGSGSEIAHTWDAWHVGMVGTGARAKEQLLSLGPGGAPGRLLLEQVGNEVWAWVSARQRLDPTDLIALLPPGAAGEVALGVGEPAHGLDGWRRSHRQAAAAIGVARCGVSKVALYEEVGTLAAILQDDLLIATLRDRYLAPLDRDGRGEQLRRTVRGYLSTECNVSSTAAALGVSRRTVRNRLRRVEERVGSGIGESLGELDLVMRLAELKLA